MEPRDRADVDNARRLLGLSLARRVGVVGGMEEGGEGDGSEVERADVQAHAVGPVVPWGGEETFDEGFGCAGT